MSRKSLYRWSQQVWGTSVVGKLSYPPGTKLLVVRTLPGAREIEDHFRVRDRSFAEEMAQSWAERTFGVSSIEARYGSPFEEKELRTYFDTYDEFGHPLSQEFWKEKRGLSAWDQMRARIRSHETKMETLRADDGQCVEILIANNVDIRQESGQPLLATMAIRFQVECAAKGIRGTLPTRASFDEDQATKRVSGWVGDFYAGRHH